jgi:hypothetical protein
MDSREGLDAAVGSPPLVLHTSAGAAPPHLTESGAVIGAGASASPIEAVGPPLPELAPPPTVMRPLFIPATAAAAAAAGTAPGPSPVSRTAHSTNSHSGASGADDSESDRPSGVVIL